MSIFNNDDFKDDTENLTLDGLISLDIFHKKDEQITVNYGLQLNSNTFIDDKIIEKSEMKQLENIDVNIKTKLTELSNNIGGVYSNNNSYSGNNIYLGSSSFNQMTLTNNGITKTLNSFELSQLDNINSNIQVQLDNKINKIVNPVNNNLCSMNNLGQIFNNDVSITTDNNLNTTSDKIIPSSTSIKYYVDNKINNLSYQSTVGQSIQLYFSNTNNNLSGYEDLLYIPDSSPEDIEMIILNNNRVLLHSYATSSLNRTIIPSGIYSFNFYCYVNDNVSLTRFEIELYKIDLSNNLTQIGDIIYSPDVNLLSVGNLTFNYTLQNNVVCNYTDKFIIKIYGFSNVSNKTINLYFYHSGNRYNSFISTPFIYKHNDLSNLDDINGNYHHLTLSQKQNATQFSSSSNSGLLSSNDFNIFNNKQNFITASTNDTYFRGDKTFQQLNKNSVNLGNVDNTSDLNKPISNATQTALNLKNDIINSSTNLSVNTISDITGNLRTSINELTNKWYQILFVSGQFGLDSNNGYQLNNPKKTIQNSLNDVNANSGVNIIILPWVYNEEININKQNITLSSLIYEKGGLVSLTGNITITSVSSSVRLSGLSMVNLTITGNCSVYIDNCKISGTLNKNVGTGYMEINNSSISGQIVLNTNSINNFLNNNISGTIINNVGYNSLQCNFSNNLISGISLNLNSGVWGFSNSVIYSTSSSTNSLLGNGIYLYLSNMSMLNPDNSNAKITLINSYYSINNSYYNKSSSTFTTSTKINRLIHNEQINVDTILLNTELNLNGLGSIQINELYMLDGITSNIQQQINNIDTSNFVSLTGIQTITNKTLTDPKLTNNRLLSSSGNNISFINVSDTIVNLNSIQSLNNKDFNNVKLNDNKLITFLNNTITIPEITDTLITTSSIQTLNNKTLVIPILSDNTIKTNSNNIITFPNLTDTLVNLTSNQIIQNKTFSYPKLFNNIISSSTDKYITFLDVSDNIVNENSGQTLNNKTLSNSCVAITQSTNDVSTKIATTQFVYNNLVNAGLIKYRYRFTVDMTNTNGFNFGLNNMYQIRNADANGQGHIYLINNSGNSITFQSSAIFNTGGAFLLINNGNTAVLNGGVFSLSKNAIYLVLQNLYGYFSDITNNNYFKFEVFYYAEKRPIINIELLTN